MHQVKQRWYCVTELFSKQPSFVRRIENHVASIYISLSGLGWCTPLITFNGAGALIAQVYYSSITNTVVGPSILYNMWTHITHTYSPTNGQRLYINGALYTSSASSTIYTASGAPDYLTIGNMLSGGGCYNPGSTTSPFQGAVDDLRVYSRELSSIDACLLAQS